MSISKIILHVLLFPHSAIFFLKHWVFFFLMDLIILF